MDKKKKLVYITTIPATFRFLNGQIGYMQQHGYIVEGITDKNKEVKEVENLENIPMHQISMSRSITPFKDFFGLIRFIFLFFKIRPDIINTSTPKAAFLSIIAGRITGVPAIVYTLRGVRYVGTKGITLKVLKLMEKISCTLAHQVLATSYASMNTVIEDNVCPKEKIQVILSGTGNGINLDLFDKDKYSAEMITELKKVSNIPEDNIIVTFVGRIVEEKGIVELIEAWKSISNELANVTLLLVGRQNEQNPIPQTIQSYIKDEKSIIEVGIQPHNKIPVFIKMSTIIVLPSYREGFGLTPLEAAAMGVPSVVSDINGLRESVLHDVTGVRVVPKSVEALRQGILSLVTNKTKRELLGKNGILRVKENFDSKKLWKSLYNFYLTL